MLEISNRIALKYAAPVLTALLLSACAPSPEVTQRGNEVMEILYPVAFKGELAKYISTRCSTLGYRNDLRTKMIQDMEEILSAKGYTPADVRAAKNQISRSRIERDLRDFLGQNKIENNSDWCEAGNREIARNTEIGRYLVT